MISENIINNVIQSTDNLVNAASNMVDKIDKLNKRYFSITLITIIVGLFTLCVFWFCYFFGDYQPRQINQETVNSNGYTSQISRQEIK